MTYSLAIADRAYSSWSLRGWLLFEKFGIPVTTVFARLYDSAFTDDLATGAAALLLAVDPALVVVGGGLSRAGDLITDGLRVRLAELCPYSTDIVAGALGDEAVATGAVRIALERATEPLFPAGLPL